MKKKYSEGSEFSAPDKMFPVRRNIYSILMNLPGQFCILQFLEYIFSPEQVPPSDSGVVLILVLNWVPPPQDFVHPE